MRQGRQLSAVASGDKNTLIQLEIKNVMLCVGFLMLVRESYLAFAKCA